MGAERFSWLHLTDLHYGLRGQNSLWPNLREAFFEDLAKLHELSGPWQAVLFTGDLVQSGDAKQFSEMQREVLDRLWGELRSLGSGEAILLAVPGNHDLYRPDEKGDDPARDTLLRKDGFDQIAEKFWEEPKGSYRRVVNNAFAGYQEWWSSSSHRPASGVSDGMLPGDFAYTIACGDRRIGIVGLNTTFLQLQGGDYKKLLVWDARQIHSVSGGAVDDWVKKHDVCLLLTHQGPDWLTPASEAHGGTEIAPAGRFAAHLFGHMHETKILYQRTGGGAAVRLCQCRSVFGMEKYGDPPKIERSHGYAAGCLEFRERDATLRLWPRIATRDTGPWRFVPDNQHAELQDGEATSPDLIAVRSVAASAGPRSSFIVIPRSNWPEELSAKGIEMPDSMLLRPETRAVRFHHLRESLRDTIIQWAIDLDQPIKLRLQAGEGGAGKTRLLIEVCERLEKTCGWRAGFVDRLQSVQRGLPVLLKEGKPCLLVLDYAESRSTEIVELVRAALHSGDTPPVRLVLLARDGGDWWNRLADAAGNDKVISTILQSFQTKAGPYRMENERIQAGDRPKIFGDALRDFAAFKEMLIPTVAPPNLADDLFGDMLFIHLAALAQLRGQPSVNDKELLGMTLGHERSYWRQLLSSAGLSDQLMPALEQGVALLTLSGGKRSAKEAKAVLLRAPALQQIEASDRAKVFGLLRHLYALDGGLGGLQPDVLGETLVSQAFERDDELLDAAFAEGIAREDIRYSLTVLTRLGRRVPAERRWLKRALERRLSALSEDALYVGIETGEPMPEILEEVVKGADRHERHRTVDLLRPKLPKETLNLANLSVEIRRQAVSFLEDKKTGKGTKRDIALADALSLLAVALHSKGQLHEAAIAAIESSRHASLAFRSNTEQDRGRLAASLSNLGSHLGGVGRFEEALEAAQKAEALLRVLAEKQPDAYTADWATSLSNLGIRLGEVGRFEEALEAAQKAETLRRELAEKQPDAHTADWATSIGNLGNRLSDVGRFEEALEAAQKAETLRRELAEKQPDAHTADWAKSLSNLGNHLRDANRFEEALGVAQKAEALLRGLAEKQPDAYTADWVKLLSNLSEAQLNLDQVACALDAAQRAASSIVPFVERYPVVYAPWLGFARRVAADAYLKVERLDEAVAEARASAEIWVDIAATRKNYEPRQVAKSFLTPMQCEQSLGQKDAALSTFKRAMGVLRIPLRLNPKPLEPIISEMNSLARDIDPDAAHAQ